MKLSLGVEELAYAIGVAGGVEAASGFLLAIFGERPQMETEGRLLAASHALVARGYLDFDHDTNEKWLDEDFLELIKPMVSYKYSLRADKITTGGESIISLYITSQKIVVHHIDNSVVSVIESLEDQRAIQDSLVRFYGLPTVVKSEFTATVSRTLLKDLKYQSVITSEEKVTRKLLEQGLSTEMVDALISSLKRPAYRGSITKISPPESEIVAERTLLLVSDQNFFWGFDIKHGESTMHIHSVSAEFLHSWLSSILL